VNRVPFVARKGPLAAVGGRLGDRVLFGARASPHNAVSRRKRSTQTKGGSRGLAT
jgi:hypothetical protein